MNLSRKGLNGGLGGRYIGMEVEQLSASFVGNR